MHDGLSLAAGLADGWLAGLRHGTLFSWSVEVRHHPSSYRSIPIKDALFLLFLLPLLLLRRRRRRR